ncbi:biotin/lipoyl-binding protein [Parasphingopyxis algicola]|uniref:efflux RND transporter periplasmic adaptor subunit n=1 Tax=Parasphingopyxis algicola TaxID=2026624 RepID=UPI00159F7765|nr:efflux RND transporter periplasmic adaptor subunit [Parasphingopyxis algicola]QLC26556.1 biotin/lipoyl-binding protein [Parasphingopyxis algicola]
MRNLSFSRQILPILAIVGIVVAAILIIANLPDRTMTEPMIEPPRSPGAQSETGSVAGTGVVEPSSEEIEIGSHVSGVVDRVYVAAGDLVTQGQPLFRIDTRDIAAQVNEARARVARLRQSIASAQTSLRVADEQLALYAGVEDQRAISEQEVIERRGVRDTARAQLAVTRAQYQEAQAALASARTQLERHTVRAPQTATVLQLNVRTGEFANAGPGMGGNSEPLIVMGVTEPLYVRVSIDENEIERLDIGAPAIVSARGDAARQVEARYVRTEPLVVPKTSLTNAATELVDVRVLEMLYALPGEGHSMFVGQQVDAFVPAQGDEEE